MNKPAPKILIIEWYDPHEEGDEWEDYIPGSMSGAVVITVGALVEEREDVYVLSYNMGEDGKVFRKGLIPKSHIRRIKELKYPWKWIGSPLTKVKKKKEIIDGT